MLFLIKENEVQETDTRIEEVKHTFLVQKCKQPFNDNGTIKYGYSVSDFADPHAVNYILWGKLTMKEKFEKKENSGEFILPNKKECPLCTTQT